MTVLGHMAKADGVVEQEEIDTIADLCNKVTGDEVNAETVQAAIAGINEDFEVIEYAAQASNYLSDEGRALVILSIACRNKISDVVAGTNARYACVFKYCRSQSISDSRTASPIAGPVRPRLKAN